MMHGFGWSYCKCGARAAHVIKDYMGVTRRYDKAIYHTVFIAINIYDIENPYCNKYNIKNPYCNKYDMANLHIVNI